MVLRNVSNTILKRYVTLRFHVTLEKRRHHAIPRPFQPKPRRPTFDCHVLCPNMTNDTSLESSCALLLESAKKIAYLQKLKFLIEKNYVVKEDILNPGIPLLKTRDQSIDSHVTETTQRM